MEAAADFIGFVNTALFVFLAVVCWLKRRRAGGRSATFAALAFSVLAIIAVVGELVPETPDDTGLQLLQRVIIATLPLFPYFLHRFATSFGPKREGFDRAALGLTVAVMIWTVLLPAFPETGAPRSVAFQIFIFVLLGQFTLLSLSAAIRLWVAGRHQPGVVRRRMSILALASAALNSALLVAGLASAQDVLWVTVATQLFAVASSVLFILGFMPPPALKVSWRRREEEEFRAAVREVVSGTNVEEMSTQLLPHVAAIVGAKRVALVDDSGIEIASFEAPGRGRLAASAEEMKLDLAGYQLVLTASAFTPFFGGEEVRLVGFLGSLLEIALERARLSKLHGLILATAGEGIYGMDPDGKLIFINPSGAQMFGWPAHEMIGCDMHSTMHHSHGDGSPYPHQECPIQQGLRDGRTHRSETEVFWRRDGTSFPVAYISTPIREADAITGVVVTFTDISERKLAEEAAALAYAREREARMVVEKTNREMESFVYTVSHDLNSPLVSISGYLDYFSTDFGEAVPEQGRFFLERIGASAHYMQALIRDLLEFSRVGRMETVSDEVDLRDLLEQIVDEVVSARPNLRVSIDDLPVVSMNKVRARQLFANLLNNAARYAGPEPEVRVGVVDTIDGRVCLSVADNGPGIPPEYRERAFEVFQRLQARQAEDGTGIGLAICKRIVESSGGEIWIADSSLGADFRMTLPLHSLTPTPRRTDSEVSD